MRPPRLTRPSRFDGVLKVALAVAALGSGLCGSALAQSPKGRSRAAAPPAFDGVWVVAGGNFDQSPETTIFSPGRPGERANVTRVQTSPKLKGTYLERQKVLQKAIADGKPMNDSGAQCLPQGLPLFWGGPFAFEILLGQKQIHFVQEWNDQTRHIYIDGRKHPTDVDPSYNGHSVAHWEGDVLVVDTVNIRADTPVNFQYDMTHSDSLHVTERLRLIAPDRLEIVQTADDPKAFVEPWVNSYVLRRRPDLEIQEYVCQANNRNPVDASGVTQAVVSGEAKK